MTRSPDAPVPLEQLLIEREGYRQIAISAGWSHSLERAYGRDEYARHRASEVDAALANRVVKGWDRLTALASAPAGDGEWRTVPTEAMCDAGWQYADSRDAVLCLGEVRDLYAAMLAAAPAALASAPVGDGVEDRDALAERLCAARSPATVARHPDYYRVQLTEESRERWRVVADAALARPRAAVGDDDIGLVEAARDLLDAHKRLGAPVAFRVDLWACLEVNLDRHALQSPPAKVEKGAGV